MNLPLHAPHFDLYFTVLRTTLTGWIVSFFFILVAAKISASLQVLIQHFWKLLFKNYQQPGCVELFSVHYREYQKMSQICQILDKEGADIVLSIFAQGLCTGLHTDHCLSILRSYAHNDECIRLLLEQRILDVISLGLKAKANVPCLSLITDGMTTLMSYSMCKWNG